MESGRDREQAHPPAPALVRAEMEGRGMGGGGGGGGETRSGGEPAPRRCDRRGRGGRWRGGPGGREGGRALGGPMRRLSVDVGFGPSSLRPSVRQSRKLLPPSVEAEDKRDWAG